MLTKEDIKIISNIVHSSEKRIKQELSKEIQINRNKINKIELELSNTKKKMVSGFNKVFKDLNFIKPVLNHSTKYFESEIVKIKKHLDLST